jgi:hypothetical protein
MNGAKVLKTCFDHMALEISNAVDVTAAFLRTVAYRFVFDEARVDEGKAPPMTLRLSWYGRSRAKREPCRRSGSAILHR